MQFIIPCPKEGCSGRLEREFSADGRIAVSNPPGYLHGCSSCPARFVLGDEAIREHRMPVPEIGDIVIYRPMLESDVPAVVLRVGADGTVTLIPLADPRGELRSTTAGYSPRSVPGCWRPRPADLR